MLNLTLIGLVNEFRRPSASTRMVKRFGNNFHRTAKNSSSFGISWRVFFESRNRCAGKSEMIDRLDRRILQILQEDATVPGAEIGRRVGLSPTPCWRRIQRLEEEGVIVGRVALLDPKRINTKVTAFVSVTTNQHNDEWRKRFGEVVRDMPEVVEFYRMAGKVD